jgi:GGDEF domain-containing protein
MGVSRPPKPCRHEPGQLRKSNGRHFFARSSGKNGVPIREISARFLVTPAMPATGTITPSPPDERQLMGRIAAAIWASIGAFGLLGTLEPLRSVGAHVEEMRIVAGISGVMAGLLFVAPARFLPGRLFNVLLVLMMGAITAISYLGGSERGDLTILFTFAVVFSAYFLPWRVSLFHLALVAVLLTSRLFAIEGDETTRIETIRYTIFLPSLISVWALVTLLQKNLADRELRLRAQEIYDLETGALGANGLGQTLDAELARSVRHARPLSLVELEVSGPAFDATDDETSRRVATAIARALVGRIRAEDRAARLGRFKFAVVAIETAESGAAVLAGNLAKQVRSRLLSLGYEGDSFNVAVGWADYHLTDGSKEGLLDEAERSLAAARPVSDGIALPPKASQRPPTLRDVPAAS